MVLWNLNYVWKLEVHNVNTMKLAVHVCEFSCDYSMCTVCDPCRCSYVVFDAGMTLCVCVCVCVYRERGGGGGSRERLVLGMAYVCMFVCVIITDVAVSYRYVSMSVCLCLYLWERERESLDVGMTQGVCVCGIIREVSVPFVCIHVCVSLRLVI